MSCLNPTIQEVRDTARVVGAVAYIVRYLLQTNTVVAFKSLLSRLLQSSEKNLPCSKITPCQIPCRCGDCCTATRAGILLEGRDTMPFPQSEEFFNSLKYACFMAGIGGELEIIKDAHRVAQANGGSCFDTLTCQGAAKGGDLSILQWLRANGAPWDESTCSAAAEGGHLHVLQWARANGCPWDKMTCAGAAKGGRLDVVQWARANGCPWDKSTSLAALKGGRQDVISWVRANGCPKYNLLDVIASSRSITVEY